SEHFDQVCRGTKIFTNRDYQRGVSSCYVEDMENGDVKADSEVGYSQPELTFLPAYRKLSEKAASTIRFFE
ncbi:unnamed protein product, partial [Allacma fusca]